LTLSAFTHLWNPIGFPPGPSNDEGIYIRRAMHVLVGQGPQESFLYDHPYFGQLFVAAVFTMIGYPNSLHPFSNGDVHSIEMLYMVPRVLMGILAVVDTFLIYKIAEHRYNRNVAFIASILFAVMPITWLTRWMLLDSLLLPFLLSSILFAVYSLMKNSQSPLPSPSLANYNKNKRNNKRIPLVLLSGIFLGLAIFTKIPAFTMIPLVGFLIYINNNKDLKILGLWFIPVILIPLIWPAYALSVGEFNMWLDGVYGQTHRGKQTLFYSLNIDLKIDPVLIILGMAGLVFAAIKRDFFLLLWAIPFLVFLYLIGFVSYWHLIPLIPAFCVAAARIIVNLSNKINYKKIVQQILPFVTILGIGIFGLVNTTILITSSNNSSYFQAAAFVAQYLANNNNKDADNNYHKITVIANPFYLWIPEYVFHLDHDYIGYYDSTPIWTRKVLLVFDDGLIEGLTHHQAARQLEKIQRNSNLYSSSKIATFETNAHNYNRVSAYLYESIASTITTNFKTYVNSTYDIKIQYPSNWEIDTYQGSEGENIVYVVDFNSSYENESDRFPDSVSIEVEKLSAKNTELDKYAESIINYYRESFPSFNLIESNTNSTLAGYPAYGLTYTTVYSRFGENDINIKAREIGAIVGDKAYYITYYAEATKYDNYLRIIQKIIDSFMITK
jgi:4-amino-4-deoxy-L-arabinose transferase-like glycosyltransferase